MQFSVHLQGGSVMLKACTPNLHYTQVFNTSYWAPNRLLCYPKHSFTLTKPFRVNQANKASPLSCSCLAQTPKHKNVEHTPQEQTQTPKRQKWGTHSTKNKHRLLSTKISNTVYWNSSPPNKFRSEACFKMQLAVQKCRQNRSLSQNIRGLKIWTIRSLCCLT